MISTPKQKIKSLATA